MPFPYDEPRGNMEWATSRLTGPEGEDWRVPVSELEDRQARLASRLADARIESALIDDPVELYWLTGGRQDSVLLIGAEGSGIQTEHWVRRSLKRAEFEGGGVDCPHEIRPHPRMSSLGEELTRAGCNVKPALLAGKIPHDRWRFLSSKMSGFSGEPSDCTGLLYELREVKSSWEISMIRESGAINKRMFDAVFENGGLGQSDLEMAGAADEVRRVAGFGGRIRMRKWPMDCDRVVIAAGRSGAVPSYFDSAVGGSGGSPISSLGAGFHVVKEKQPVLVDIVHVHRGYVSDCTRMFTAGKLASEWEVRLEDMSEIGRRLVGWLGKGKECSESWDNGIEMASEMGHSKHLMGISPNQACFLGHSVGLELDETPVVARGFDRPLPKGGTMAIEPKVIHPEGAIGTEDTWVRVDDGMECLTAGSDFPLVSEW